MITKTLAIALVIGIALAGAVLQMAELPPYSLLAVGAIGVTVVIALAFLAAYVTRQESKGETVTVLEAWEAIGHDIGVNPSKWELLQSLQHMSHLVTILSEATNPAVNLVLAERIRQIQLHSYDCDHDDEHVNGELLTAAICYALEAQVAMAGGSNVSRIVPTHWPWVGDSWKPGPARRMLVKSLALGLAELERQLRADEPAEAVQS